MTMSVRSCTARAWEPAGGQIEPHGCGTIATLITVSNLRCVAALPAWLLKHQVALGTPGTVQASEPCIGRLEEARQFFSGTSVSPARPTRTGRHVAMALARP